MAVPAKHGLRSHQDQMAQGWRLYRRWRSGPQLGWPRLTAEIQELIATMASEEPALGHSVSAASFSTSASWSVLARSAASVGVALRDRPARAGEPSSPTMLGDLGRRPLRRPDPHLPDAPTSSSLSVMAAASFFTTKYLCRQVLSVGCVADVPLSPRSSKLCS